MSRGVYSFIREAWKKPSKEMLRKRFADWRSQPAVTRIDKPTRLDQARALGYKAKKGFIVARVKLLRGGRRRPRPSKKGRKLRRQTIRKVLGMNYQWVAEMRANRKYSNLEVLNSYPLGKDGMYYFFEVIMLDPSRPEIQTDKDVSWICLPANRRRVFRGLTSAARKSRGLRKKGKRRER